MSEVDSSNRVLEGYTGEALKILGQAGAKPGSRINVKTKDGFEATGLLIQRYEGLGSNHIVLKLKSGYNIGLSSESISSIILVEELPQEVSESVDGSIVTSSSARPEKKVLLLSTGGTIASKVDYRTGAVKPAYTAQELYSAIPELGNIAEIKSEVVFSTFSENLAQEHWSKLSKKILEGPKEGVVVMLGTDTLAFASAALSFALIGFAHPVACVGAQRSSDRPSADSASNLKAAVRFVAYSDVRGVFVAMHANESDDVIAIHSGVRVRKNHTSRRDAFESIDVPHFAVVAKDRVQLNPEYPRLFDPRIADSPDYTLKTDFESKVALIKFFPGFDPSILDHLAREEKVRGLILEGTGLGHVSSSTVQKVAELVQRGVFVGVTSQCIWGHVNLNVYETGIDLVSSGAVGLGNMLSETAYVKLSWALGNFPIDRVKTIMGQNLVGETTERIRIA